MNPIANELNEQIKSNARPVYECLSTLGKKLYFPKGILSQGSEAKVKGTRFNATVGIATKNKNPMVFKNIEKHFAGYHAADVFPYVAVSGRKKLRELWKNKMVTRNPKLANANISLPFPTGGITHGISIMADMFVEPGDVVLLPDMMWGNYRLTFDIYRGAKIENYRFFNDDNELDIESFRNALQTHGKNASGKIIVLLNFPNNPSGYTCTEKEAAELQNALLACADSGTKVICLCDEAYFGLFFEDCLNESFFSLLAGKHENLIPVKLDGATKEYFVWGFRLGFLTFGIKSAGCDSVYEALEKKISGLVRGTISSLNHASQTIIENEMLSAETEKNWNACFHELKTRANKIKALHTDGRYDKYWTAYPFNSGYFMCIKLKNGINAEKLRIHLLDKYQTGTVSTSATDLRIAFSCLDLSDIESCFELVAKGCQDLISD